MDFELATEPLDVGQLRKRLQHPSAGALVDFEGWVRDHNEGRRVERLEYEAYPALALKEGQRILEAAKAKFSLRAACAVHRTGLLEIGESAVWVGVSSDHRAEGFEACRWIIDRIKMSVPVWKREHYVGAEPEWVACHRCTHAVEPVGSLGQELSEDHAGCGHGHGAHAHGGHGHAHA